MTAMDEWKIRIVEEMSDAEVEHYVKEAKGKPNAAIMLEGDECAGSISFDDLMLLRRASPSQSRH